MTPAEILAIVRWWPEPLRSEWDERCALIECGCRVSREESERRAFELLKHRAPMKQTTMVMGDD